VRAESGNDISKENPSLIAGAAGGRGSDPALRPFSCADFVSVPIANFVTVGGSQALRVPRAVLLDFIPRIIRLRTHSPPEKKFIKSGPTGQGRAGLRADAGEKPIIAVR
jgi:hypothetical protein